MAEILIAMPKAQYTSEPRMGETMGISMVHVFHTALCLLMETNFGNFECQYVEFMSRQSGISAGWNLLREFVQSIDPHHASSLSLVTRQRESLP